MEIVVVNNQNSQRAIDEINAAPNIAIDTETTGLKVYKNDRLFSIIIATGTKCFYFNYNDVPDHNDNLAPVILDRADIPKIVSPDYKGRIFFHNAKFDLKMLEHEGLNLRGHRIYDTAGLARLEYNDRMQLKLESLAHLVGMKKLGDEIKDYCKKHKLLEKVKVPSKKQKETNYFYYLVPFDFMVDYATIDAIITFKLGLHFLRRLAQLDAGKTAPGPRKLKDVMQTENKLTPILMSMQDDGMLIDETYVKEALEYETNEYKKHAHALSEMAGIEFNDGPKFLTAAFEKLGYKYPLTAKGNPSFTDEVLTSLDNPFANALKDYRYSYKKSHTYFANFLHLSDEQNIIHAGLNQYKARTGRFSSSDPNLQNTNRGKPGERYPVKRSFIPRPGTSFFLLDFDQFEYRKMLNKAGEMAIIRQILDEGLDVHTATANLMAVERYKAKTINFMLLYGGGIAVLARALFTTHMSEDSLKLIQKYHFYKEFQWSKTKIIEKTGFEPWEIDHAIDILTQALELKELYFRKLPKVKTWVKRTVGAAERGVIYNDFGRAYRFMKTQAYKAPNYTIQGGTADWIKIAMIRIDEFLKQYKSKMLLQVHDELIFEIVEGEEHIVYGIKEIMETVAPTEHLPYTVGIEHSAVSWADKKEYTA